MSAHLKRALIPVLLVCVGYAYYNISDAALKMAAGKYHFSQIFMFNSIVIFICVSIYGALKDGVKSFRTKKPVAMFFRALLAQLISIGNILALPHIHLTTFYTLVFTSPFWVAVISAYFLKDHFDKRRAALILAGFAVVLFIFRPGSGIFNIWSLIILGCAFLYSVQLVLMRHLGSAGESRPFMIMIGAVMSMVIAIPLLPAHYVPPTNYDWGLFVIMGITNGIGLLCISYAFQAASSAAAVAPYHYTQMIWGALFGYFLFHEVPSVELMIGAVLIILLGILLVIDEARRSAPLTRGA
jgi:drug/metabolite transporter (DMT)-like permease